LTLFHLQSFLSHWLNAVDEHSIHSPFFFDFYKKVIRPQKEEPALSSIESIRQKLLSTQSEIFMNDLGAPSRHFKSNNRKIAEIAATSLTPEKFCRLYERMIHYFDSKNIVELGTSLGVTTLYLAQPKLAKIHTFEGNASVADIALTNFEFAESKNIKIISGNIDETLPAFLQTPQKIDFVLVDANHRYQPTLNYFEWLSKRMADKGVIVIDDIHHSPEMEQAWQKLKSNELVYGSIDLFRCGIIFFDPALNKQHFICQL
jgi:predicted O-methyltransferase YrrM